MRHIKELLIMDEVICVFHINDNNMYVLFHLDEVIKYQISMMMMTSP